MVKHVLRPLNYCFTVGKKKSNNSFSRNKKIDSFQISDLVAFSLSGCLSICKNNGVVGPSFC